LLGGPLPERDMVGLGIQLAQGLAAARQQGVVHRDLKPANLRLTSDGRLNILDFGLAQFMPHASAVGQTATLTQSQEVTGTLPYMAPEQLRGGVADARSDIWAAGAVLYEMSTGHLPFDEKVPSALTADISHKTPAAPRSLKPGLSSKLEAVILKCLQKESANRYQTAGELQSDLERVSTGVTPHAARRFWPIMVTSVIVIMLLTLGADLYLRRSPKLTEKDTIVLADFTNMTGDPVFDGTLRQALAVQLEQSPFLSLVSEERIQQTLRLMGRPADAPLTPKLARELCQRSESRAVLEGSIAQVGTQYSLILKGVNCANGESLASTQAQVSDKNHVLDTGTAGFGNAQQAG
jgi:eukaryotic-like serine/threonine-protein kinase